MPGQPNQGLLPRLQRRRTVLIGVLALQALCILFLMVEASPDVVGMELEDILGTRDLLELFVVLALIFGAVYLVLELRRMAARQKLLEDQMKVASGAFHELLNQHFSDSALTPSERDVAMFIIKGMPIAKIAALRSSAEGTVKAHSSRIYAKAGVTGRHQLTSLFVEELLVEGLPNAGAPIP